MLSYRELKPHSALRQHIICYWLLSSSDGRQPCEFNRVLPDGCVDIIFNLGDPIIKSSELTLDRSEAEPAYIVGTMQKPLIVGVTGQVDQIGIRIRPGRAGSLLYWPLWEIADQMIKLKEFWKEDTDQIIDRLMMTKDLRKRIGIIETILLERLRQNPVGDKQLQNAVNQLYLSEGQMEIGKLESLTGLSLRQLERKFKVYVGLGPKKLARIIRFQKAFSLLPRYRGNVASLAHETGYSDQAHLIKEFKLLSGLAPGEYLKRDHDVGFFQDLNNE